MDVVTSQGSKIESARHLEQQCVHIIDCLLDFEFVLALKERDAEKRSG